MEECTLSGFGYSQEHLHFHWTQRHSEVQVTKMPTFKNQGLSRRARGTPQLACCSEVHNPELWIARRNHRVEDIVAYGLFNGFISRVGGL